MREAGVQAVVIVIDGMLFPNMQRIADLGLRHRIALGAQVPHLARAGGLIAYAPDVADNWRRSASYVHRILQGANPAEPPVELPSRIKLTINVKTAKALGFTVPQSMLLVADEVIDWPLLADSGPEKSERGGAVRRARNYRGKVR